MVQVSYPGVYIQELPSGVNTITGVATSVAAFFGRTAKGPIDRAVQCFSYSDFLRAFGGPHPASDLAKSVRQFFDNGGSECWVVRLAHGAQASTVTLHSLGGSPNVAGDPVLVAAAKNPGVWGDALRLEVDYGTANPDESFNLRVLRMSGEDVEDSEEFTSLTMDPDSPRFAPTFVTQSSDLIRVELPGGFDPDAETGITGYSESGWMGTVTEWRDRLNEVVHPADPADRRSKFEIRVDDSNYIPVDLALDTSWTDFTGSAGDIASELEGRINPQIASAGVSVDVDWTTSAGPRMLRLDSATADGGRVTIRRVPDSDLAGAIMLGLDQGGSEAARYSDLRPAPNGTVFTDSFLELGRREVDDFTDVNIGGFTIHLADTGTHILNTTGTDTDPWYEDAYAATSTDHREGLREKLSLLVQAINDDPLVPARAEVWGSRLAIIPDEGTANAQLTLSTSGGDGHDIGGSFNENVRRYSLGTVGAGIFQTPGQPGLDDDGNPPDLADYRGSEQDGTGFHALDTVDLFNLMVLPRDEDIPESDHTALLGPASIYCQKNRAFLLIDAPPSWTREGRLVAGKADVDALRALVVKDHCAVFYPDLLYREGGVQKSIGPTGAIAGLMARIDATRGVWKAPAGTEADIRGISGLAVKLSDMRNGVLNDLAVNCLRVFPSGFVNWGARTFEGAKSISTDWKYVPVRRLALFLEESLYRGTKWIVFEPNDEPLWAKIRLNLNAFMMSLFRQGAFQGDTPDKAFYVKCDSETTTQNDRNQGIVNIEIGFAPLKPAEFVVIKIQQMAGEL